MHENQMLDRICSELISVHQAHTILLYGSRSDGSAGPDSDYDVSAFAPIEKPVRDARVLDGAYWDVFVYPEQVLREPSKDYFKLRGCKVLRQRESQAEKFLQRLDEIFAAGPELLPPDEIAVRKAWPFKMVSRIQRGDIEGDYRRVWLLTTLLIDYFEIRGLWYQGPKKAFRWLEEFDPPVYRAFSLALKPGASHETIRLLANCVVGKDLSNPPSNEQTSVG